MKTNAFRYLGLALMAVLTLSLTSCEVEIDSFYDDDNIGQALILFGWNILMDMWRHSNIISVGTGRIMHRLPFVWITVAMMYLTWMMYTSEEID